MKQNKTSCFSFSSIYKQLYMILCLTMCSDKWSSRTFS